MRVLLVDTGEGLQAALEACGRRLVCALALRGDLVLTRALQITDPAFTLHGDRGL